MKKQISLLLVTVVLNLSNGAQAGSFYSTASRAARQTAPLISRYATRPSGLSQSAVNAARTYTTKTPAFLPKPSTPLTARAFTQSTGKLAPEIVAKPSYWEQFAKWFNPMTIGAATAIAGKVYLDTNPVKAEDANQSEQEGWYQQSWIGQWITSRQFALKAQLRELLPSSYPLSKKQLAEVEKRLDKIRDVASMKDRYRDPILRSAIEANDLELMKLLLKRGVSVNDKDSNGSPLLFVAIHHYNEHPETLDFLLQRGIDVEAKDKYGRTALMLFAQKYPAAIEKLLQKNKFSYYINARDNAGLTALDHAKLLNQTDAIDLLKKYGAKESTTRPYPVLNYFN